MHLNRSTGLIIREAQFPADMPPMLLVVVDTEEEFDWSQPFARNNTGTSSIQFQWRAQEVFDRHGVKPTYLVDYPVATDSAAVASLGRLHEEERCQIGAHLHPWVNPPHDEVVCAINSYPGNLAPELERTKLKRLSEAIELAFGLRPTLYKAGRYGFGPATASTLEALGYEIDLSIVPHSTFAEDGGPDFFGLPDRPFWFGTNGTLLEIPLSRGFVGLARRYGAGLFRLLSAPVPQRLHALGVAARSRVLERFTLTPEGFLFGHQRRLVEALLQAGHRIFSLTYHSPSLVPGNTPYVRSELDLSAFLETLDRFVSFFLGELGGRTATPFDVRNAAKPIP